MSESKPPSAGYGVDIHIRAVHAEVEDLIQAHAALDGLTGDVRIFDRRNGALILEGTATEVQNEIAANVNRHGSILDCGKIPPAAVQTQSH